LLDAQALPEQDAEWIRTTIQEQKASDKVLAAACQTIDKKEVEGWVAKAADQGNAASLYLRSVFRSNQSVAVSQQQLQEAVDTGYPEAQAWIAQGLTNGAPGLPRGGESSETLFKEAADSLPYAESLLAVCEFKGCPGVEADIPSAVAHAREAAQRGSFDAMIDIGPQLQASQIDPNEVAAWNLVGAMLTQQGCSHGGLNVQWVTAATNTLTSSRVSDKAKALADQYWQQYGAQMMSNIGCAP
jgi:TPR repeat protein